MDPAKTGEKAAQSTLQEKEPQAVVVRRESERELISWIAQARPFRTRSRQFYVTIFAISGILGLILFLAEGIMPVLLITALVFLYYVLSTVPPGNIEYKITTRGVKIADKLIDWRTLIRFWFVRRLEQEVLVLDTVTIPGRIEIVIDPELKESIKKETSAYIPFEEIPASGLDKVIDWFSQKLPGNG